MNPPSEWNDALRMREIRDAGIGFSFDKDRDVASIAESPANRNGEFLEESEEHDLVMGADRG